LLLIDSAMFGGTFEELLFFGRQFGFSLAGAAALWGFVFWRFRHKDKREPQCLMFDWIAGKLFLLLSLGIFAGFASFVVLQLLSPAYAHEGIVLTLESHLGSAALQFMWPFYLASFAVCIAGIALWRARPKLFLEKLGILYAVQFVLAFSILSVPAWTGKLDFAQVFFAGHSVHSIFTLGTVIVLDYLIIVSKNSKILQQHVFPLFPTLSKVIWAGLALDFLSVALVFDQAISLTPKFFFMQTAIGILIINGVFLVGPITRKMLASVSGKGAAVTPTWMLLAGISGVISICSWSFNTFIDSFHALTFSYWQFMLLYIGLLGTAFVGHLILDHFTKPAPNF
jgi:hypothetical protein